VDKPPTLVCAQARATQQPQNIDLTHTPAGRPSVLVITGVSVSWKSSLAFDNTIYAEPAPLRVEFALSRVRRQFLEAMENPDVDSHRRHPRPPSHPAEEHAF